MELRHTQQEGTLTELTSSTIDRFAQLSNSMIIRKSEFVYTAGSFSESIYLLKSGRVKLFRMSDKGREVLQWYCFPGEVFGIAAMTCDEKHDMYAEACDDSELLCLNSSQFWSLLYSSPDFALNIIKQLSSRLNVVGEMLLDSTTGSAPTRIANALHRLGRHFGIKIDHGLLLNVVLTHKELADMVGTCRQTVTKELGKLKNQGLIEFRKQTIFIPKPELLSNIAG